MFMLSRFWSYCLQCPNKRVMVMKGNNRVETDGKDEEDDDDAILQLDTNLLTLEDVFYDTDLRSNLFKEWEDDMN